MAFVNHPALGRASPDRWLVWNNQDAQGRVQATASVNN